MRMRGYLVPLTAGVALTVSAFLPWVVIGDTSLRGIPNVPAIWVAGLGALAAVLASLSIMTRKNSRHPLLVVGLMALGIMILSGRILPRSAGERAQTLSQAFAIVEDTPMAATPDGARRQRHLRRARVLRRHRPVRPDDRRQTGVAAIRGGQRGRRRLGVREVREVQEVQEVRVRKGSTGARGSGGSTGPRAGCDAA